MTGRRTGGGDVDDGLYDRRMVTNGASVTVLGIERADYRPLSDSLQQTLGEALLAEPIVEAAWVAAEDAGTPNERHYLQVAVADGTDGPQAAVDAIWPLIEKLQRRHRVALAVAMYMREDPDVVPGEIVQRFGLKATHNPFVTLHRTFSWR